MNPLQVAISVAVGVSTLWGAGLIVSSLATKDDVDDVRVLHQYDATSQQIYNYRQEQYQIEDRAVDVPLTYDEKRRLDELVQKRKRAERRQEALEQELPK